MNEKKKTGNIVATIIGIIVYVLVFIVIGRITRMVSSGEFSTEQIRLVNSFNGVFSQIQVLSIVVMVVMDRKRGFIVGMILQGVGLLNVLIVQLLIAHNVMSLPGAVTGIVSIIIYVIIYTSMEKNRKLHDEVTAKYQELIEKNRTIEEKDQTLTYLAYYDRMTGLPNRAFFTDKLQEYMDAGKKLAIIYMDADNFKQINDNFGHQTGDELIKVYAERFERYCADKYTCAKVGGDEFGMILEGSYTEADILNIVEQLRALFGEPVNMAGGQFSITMSYGICGFPNDGSTPEALIVAADTALYNAKLGGKNRPCFFSQHSLG